MDNDQHTESQSAASRVSLSDSDMVTTAPFRSFRSSASVRRTLVTAALFGAVAMVGCGDSSDACDADVGSDADVGATADPAGSGTFDSCDTD